MFKNKTLGYYAIYLVVTILLISGYGVAQEVVSSAGGGGGAGGYPAATSPGSTVNIAGSGTSALTFDVNTNTIQTQAMLQYLAPITFTATLATSTYTGSVSPAIGALIDGSSNPVFVNMCPASSWTGGAVSLVLNSLTTHNIKISGADPTSTQLAAGSCYLLAWNPTASYYEVLSLPSGGLGGSSTIPIWEFNPGFNTGLLVSQNIANVTSGFIPAGITTTTIQFYVSVGDGGSGALSNIGFYTGTSGGTCTKVSEIGAQGLNTTGGISKSWSGGAKTFSAGRVYLVYTSSGTTLQLASQSTSMSYFSGGNVGPATASGVLPATFTCPTDAPTNGPNLQAIIF